MVVFIDTSSLAKRYIDEVGSDKIDLYFVPENTVHLAPTTAIEFRSVLSRRKKDGSLPVAVAETALSEWLLEQPEFQTHSFSSELRDLAIEIVERHGIKTLDAIQLAVAQISGAATFVTSDKALATAARTAFAGDVVFV